MSVHALPHGTLQPPVARAEWVTLHDLRHFAPEWCSLLEETASSEPFYRPEWIAAHLKAFVPDDRVLLISARTGGRLRAVLPLMESRGFYGLPARVLRSPGNIHTPRFDLVRGEGDWKSAVARTWECLKGIPAWDVLVLHSVPERGAAHYVLQLAAGEGWPTAEWPEQEMPFVHVTGADPLEVPADSHFRQNLRRRLRKAHSIHRVEMRRITQADPDALAQFYCLEASGWKGRRGTAIASSAPTRRFYDEVARAAAEHGYFALHLLLFDGTPVAGHFGLHYRHRYYTPKVAYDERYAAFGPGHLIFEAVLRDCARRGIREVDFLGPSLPWKMEWTPHVRRHSRCFVFHKSWRGRSLHVAERQIMRLRSAVRETRE